MLPRDDSRSTDLIASAGMVIGGTTIALPACAANAGWVVGGRFAVATLACNASGRYPSLTGRQSPSFAAGPSESALCADPETPASAAIACAMRYALPTQGRQRALLRIALEAIGIERIKSRLSASRWTALSQRRIDMRLTFRAPVAQLTSGSITAPLVQVAKRPHHPSGSLSAGGISCQQQFLGTRGTAG
jgi:hypothetical protein